MESLNKKISVFYLICQTKKTWKEEYYIPQIDRLYSSGLYDNIDFIDIYVSCGNETLPIIPDKTRRIEFLRNTDIPHETQVLESIHEFSKKSYDYNILYFHSSGASTTHEEYSIKKALYRDYMEYCNLDLWKECNLILNFYDTVGTDLSKNSWFAGGELCFHAPHYTGNFWWTKSSYYRTLDLDFLHQNVSWKRYLAEFFVGSGSGKNFSLYNLNKNMYENYVTYDKDKIYDHVTSKIQEIWSPL